MKEDVDGRDKPDHDGNGVHGFRAQAFGLPRNDDVVSQKINDPWGRNQKIMPTQALTEKFGIKFRRA